MLCSVLNLLVIVTRFNGSSIWWNANEVLKNFIQSAFFGGIQKQCIWISLMDGVLARYGRQTLAFYTWHRDAWAACFLRGESIHESQPLHQCLRDSSPLSPGNVISRNPAAHLSLHNCTAGHVRMTGSIPEPISVWGTLENKSFPHGPLEINRYQALNKKSSLFPERTRGKQVWSSFCWSNPLFQTNRQSGISKKRLSFFNPLSWPIATALLQDSYKSCENMNVMERNCKELWEVGGGEGMQASLKFCQMHPLSKSVLWNKERFAHDNAMAWTWVGLTFYSAVSRSTPLWIPSPQNNDQMWLLL